MGANTKIEWARHTFNPWIGCTKVTAACDHCYAEDRMDRRLKAVEWGPHGERKRTTAQYWQQPRKWDRDAKAAGERPFVFCASLADVFDNQVPDIWRQDLFQLIWETPQLVWLLLTKRPQNIIRLAERANGMPKNVALGTSCGDQADADRNIPKLLEAAGIWHPAFTFVSAEPLLGPIDFQRLRAQHPAFEGVGVHLDCLAGEVFDHGETSIERASSALDWIIVGGESGPSARPMHPRWAREIRDQCEAAGTPFMFKQWGEWSPHTAGIEGDDGSIKTTPRGGVNWQAEQPGAISGMFRVGKKRAGRLLDGREHNAVPAVR